MPVAKKKKIVQSEKFTQHILNNNLQKNKVRKKYTILVLFYSGGFLEIFQVNPPSDILI